MFGFKSKQKLFILRAEKNKSARLSCYEVEILHNAATSLGLVQIDKGLYEDQVGNRFFVDYATDKQEEEFNKFYG